MEDVCCLSMCSSDLYGYSHLIAFFVSWVLDIRYDDVSVFAPILSNHRAHSHVLGFLYHFSSYSNCRSYPLLIIIRLVSITSLTFALSLSMIPNESIVAVIIRSCDLVSFIASVIGLGMSFLLVKMHHHQTKMSASDVVSEFLIPPINQYLSPSPHLLSVSVIQLLMTCYFFFSGETF